MSDDDLKVVDLAERRKRDQPVAQTGLGDVSDIIATLIETMESKGMNSLIGSYMGGWQFSITRGADNGS